MDSDAFYIVVTALFALFVILSIIFVFRYFSSSSPNNNNTMSSMVTQGSDSNQKLELDPLNPQVAELLKGMCQDYREAQGMDSRQPSGSDSDLDSDPELGQEAVMIDPVEVVEFDMVTPSNQNRSRSKSKGKKSKKGKSGKKRRS